MTRHTAAQDLGNALIAAHAEAHDLLARLTAHVDSADPDSANWGHVADLNRVNQYLRYALGEES